MAVLVLGCPVVTRDQAYLRPSRRSARVLLGVFGLRPNRRLAADWLVGALWPDRPPPSAAANLRSHIAELRRLLGTGPRIERAGDGYLLAATPGDVDTAQFLDLVHEARNSRDQGDNARAAVLLAEALALWRGLVLEGIPVPSAVQPQATVLDEERLSATEELEWAPSAPDDVPLELVLVCTDQLDEEPEVMLIGAVPSTASLEDLLDRTDAPRLAEVEQLGAADAALLHATPASAVAHDPAAIPLTQHRPGMMSARTEFFSRPLPADAITALVTHVAENRVFGEFRQVAFTPWRGAYGRVPPDATAFVHRAPAYLVKHTVLLGPNGAARRGGDALDWLTAGWAALHPWGTAAPTRTSPTPR